MSKPEKTLSQSEHYELSEKLIRENKTVRLKASGLSMYPHFVAGDEMEIVNCPMPEIKVGDVVVFKRQNRWIGHRVIATFGNSLTLRGDSRLRIDEKVDDNNFIGKVAAVYRNDKKLDLGNIPPRELRYRINFLLTFCVRIINKLRKVSISSK